MRNLQAGFARRGKGISSLLRMRGERLHHPLACVGSAARDVVENGLPLLFGSVARLLVGLLDAVEGESLFTLDSSELAPPSVSFCSATLLASTTLSKASSIPASASERALSCRRQRQR